MKMQNSSLNFKSFQEMSLSPVLMTALEKMTIKKPTDVQSRAIPEALRGVDLIGVAQTGSGKTLAFALPILTALEKNSQARALVLAPSREMAQQIFKVFEALCADLPMTTSLIIGGVPSAKQINSLKKIPKIIVATPGRLNDHLVGNKLLLQNVAVIAIDEADRMLDMGFLPQLQNIQKTLRGQRQTLMFSASFNPGIESIAQLFMNSRATIIRSERAEEPVASLTQKILFIGKAEKNDRLLDELNAAKGGIIVFCGNQGSCERMGQYLEEYGYSVDMIHSGLSQGHRNRVLRNFREGTIRIVVATDLLARGIDVPHVDHVINFEMPFQSEDFLHRIGRTARAGRGGNAITFVSPGDQKMFQKIKPYLLGAKEIKVDPNFEFNERHTFNNVNRYRNKKLDTKSAFDPNQKMSHKPKVKTIGSFDKKNKKASDGEKVKVEKRSDRYEALAKNRKGTTGAKKTNGHKKN